MCYDSLVVTNIGDTTIANDNKTKDQGKVIMNERIRAREVRLIDQNGENHGIVETSKALKMAYDADLDLVLIKKRRELLEDIFNIKLDSITQRKIEEIFEKLIIRVLEIIS